MIAAHSRRLGSRCVGAVDQRDGGEEEADGRCPEEQARLVGRADGARGRACDPQVAASTSRPTWPPWPRRPRSKRRRSSRTRSRRSSAFWPKRQAPLRRPLGHRACPRPPAGRSPRHAVGRHRLRARRHPRTAWPAAAPLQHGGGDRCGRKPGFCPQKINIPPGDEEREVPSRPAPDKACLTNCSSSSVAPREPGPRTGPRA